MSLSKTAAVAVMGCLLLAGCGFHPMNAKRDSIASPTADLSQIKIELIQDRSGQELRNDLLDRLNPDGQPTQPRYALAIQLTVLNTGVAIAKDASTIRNNLTISAQFTLTDLQTGKTVFSGTSSGIDSYGQITNSYSTVVAQKDTETRVLTSMADDITTRLSLFMRRNASAQ